MEHGPRPPAIERKSDRPVLAEIQERAKGRLNVAEHEFTHIVAIWGIGESTNGATVNPSSDYEGATFHSGEMSASKMQIAAMASADHSGNGSDKMKAYMLQFYGGIGMGQAETVAKSIIRSYREDVLHIAAMYLAAEGEASDSRLRQYLRWAEEEVKEQEEYSRRPIPSWSDELDEKQKEAEQIQVTQPDSTLQTTISYNKNGTEHYNSTDGTEEVFCTLCRQIDQHEERCPNAVNQNSWGKLYPLFPSPSPLQKAA